MMFHLYWDKMSNILNQDSLILNQIKNLTDKNEMKEQNKKINNLTKIIEC